MNREKRCSQKWCNDRLRLGLLWCGTGMLTTGRDLIVGGNFFKKSSAGNFENASFMTDSTRTVTCSRICGLTSLMISPEFWLMKSLTVFATAGARPSKRLSNWTWAEAMSKSILVLLMLNFWFPAGPTGSMAAEPTPVTPLRVAWNGPLPEIWNTNTFPSTL